VDRNGKVIARFEPDDSMVDLEEQVKVLLIRSYPLMQKNQSAKVKGTLVFYFW